MKAKNLLVSVFAVFALVLLLNVASASNLNVNFKSIEIDGTTVLSDGVADIDNLVIFAGEKVNIKTAIETAGSGREVRVKAWIPGYRNEIEASTDRFNIVEDSKTYTKHLSLEVPSDIDLTDEYTLHISVEAREGSFEKTINLNIQRISYNVEILSVETEKSANAGSTLAVDVVVKNRGYNKLEDNFVVARIPELNVVKKAYFGDLKSVDDAANNDGDDEDDNEDAVVGRLYVPIPSDAEAGVYTLEVEAYNADASDKVTRNLIIAGSEQRSDVLIPVKTRELAKGSEATYDLIVINNGKKLAAYEIIPEAVENLAVKVSEPIITVSPDSSKTVQITVKGMAQGTYNFGVNVHTEGKLVKRVPLVANVVSGLGATGSNAVVLTVVLAIIFVVLLIVLIVLLTRKPKRTEEFGESYY